MRDPRCSDIPVWRQRKRLPCTNASREIVARLEKNLNVSRNRKRHLKAASTGAAMLSEVMPVSSVTRKESPDLLF
jgi:hypothetical protein